LFNYILIFLLSVIFSTLSAISGLGGGIFIIPFLILIFHLPVKFVAGTMLLAMIPYAGVASVRNLRVGYVNYKIALFLEVGAIGGVTFGSQYSAVLPDLLLKLLFIFVVFYLLITLQLGSYTRINLVAISFLWLNRFPPHFKSSISTAPRIGVPGLVIVGFVAGLFSGLLGVGGGFLITPTLILGLNLPSKIAVGTSIFMIFLTAIVGAATHVSLGHVNYLLAGVVAAGMVLGAYSGSGFLKILPEKTVRLIITIVLSVAGILIFFR